MLYDQDGNKIIRGIRKGKNQFLIDTMQQGMMYLAFSVLVVSRIHGWESAKKYLEKVYSKLTRDYPEYFVMLKKIEQYEWEDIYNNWMQLDKEPKAKT